MNYSELQDKYSALDREYKRIRDDAALEMCSHPCESNNWLDYARDQEFSFASLRMPNEDDGDFYKSFHDNIEQYLELLTISKDFIICSHCHTRWTLLIQLNGKYEVYDQHAKPLTNISNNFTTGDKNVRRLCAFDIPDIIKTMGCNYSLYITRQTCLKNFI